MADFVVHTVPGSPFARAVMALLEEKGAPWRLAPIIPGQHRQKPHLSRHPFGRMPVLEHGDFCLYETQAILRYLDRVLPAPALTPADARRAARMDQSLNIADCYLFPDVANVIVFQRVMAPALLGSAPNEAAIAAAMPNAETVFAELENLLREPFFVGETMTLADLALAAHMDMFALTPEWQTLTSSRPKLVAWLERMRERPSLRATTWQRVRELAAAA